MKNTIKFCLIGLLVLIGFGAVSCTDGEFAGRGGAGNLNIINIPSEYQQKYMEVSGTIGGKAISFKPESPRVQIGKDGKVKAPLYISGEIFNGHDNNVQITATIYQDKNTATVLHTKTFDPIPFYYGSGVVYW